MPFGNQECYNDIFDFFGSGGSLSPFRCYRKVRQFLVPLAYCGPPGAELELSHGKCRPCCSPENPKGTPRYCAERGFVSYLRHACQKNLPRPGFYSFIDG